jgi:hypothetical protein
MVGINMRTVVTDPKGLDDLLQRAANLTGAEMEESDLSCDVQIVNKYTGTIDCVLSVQMGGTENTRLYVLHIRRKEQVDDNLLVCDERGAISFATVDLARCLGYTLDEILALKLEALIPQPVRAMHASFLLDAPPQPPVTSCRNGIVVNLVAQNKSLFPARLSITQRDEPSGLKHVVKVRGARGVGGGRRGGLSHGLLPGPPSPTPPLVRPCSHAPPLSGHERHPGGLFERAQDPHRRLQRRHRQGRFP